MIRPLMVMMLITAATPAIAQYDDERICTASAQGKRGAHVDVVAQVGTDGEIWSRTVNWTPPLLDASTPRYHDLRNPSPLIRYDDAEADAIGEMTAAIGEISSLGGPDGALRRLSMWVIMDDGDSWEVEPEPASTVYSIGGSLFRYASADLTDTDWDGEPQEILEAGGRITLSLRDTIGRPVAQARYDLGAISERDRLFRSAWRKVENMAKNQRLCSSAER